MSRGAGVILIAFFLASFATASSVEKLDLQTLTASSDLIGIARVVNAQTVLENGQPWMITTVLMETQLKGARQSSVQIRIPGGYRKIGNRTLIHIPTAREWLFARMCHPNRRRQSTEEPKQLTA